MTRWAPANPGHDQMGPGLASESPAGCPLPIGLRRYGPANTYSHHHTNNDGNTHPAPFAQFHPHGNAHRCTYTSGNAHRCTYTSGSVHRGAHAHGHRRAHGTVHPNSHTYGSTYRTSSPGSHACC